MLEYFNTIKEKVVRVGEKVGVDKWKLETCTYGVDSSGEYIVAPGLVEVRLLKVEGVPKVSVVKGSEDSLKFLATSI